MSRHGHSELEILRKEAVAMKKPSCVWLAASLVLILATTLTARSVRNQGRKWLDAQTDPSAVNVNGVWDAEEWGVLHLTQAEGSREVSGSNHGYYLTGVVSGKRLFLLFSSEPQGAVYYCAILSSDGGNSLAGTYSYPKSRFNLGSGLCQDKGTPMNMTKK
jgi:hypothetical protein